LIVTLIIFAFCKKEERVSIIGLEIVGILRDGITDFNEAEKSSKHVMDLNDSLDNYLLDVFLIS